MLNELGGKTTLACASFCRANGATITDVEYLLYNGRSRDCLSILPCVFTPCDFLLIASVNDDIFEKANVSFT